MACVIVTALALTGCATTVPMKTTFDAVQRAYAEGQVAKGSGTVKGYAFYHAPTGRTYTAGGDWIRLIPVTDYARERMRIIYGENHFRFAALFGTSPGEPEPDYVTFTRKEKADIHGRFEFQDVKPGRWFVQATVQWQASGEAYLVTIYDEIDVKAGETTQVVLSGN
jgi:hypothetical protein